MPLTTGTSDHYVPQVSGDRVVWRGTDGAHFQIFTRKVGVDSSPVPLTTDAHDHDIPQVSGDRVVWLGSDGVHDQIFRAKLITTPTITRSPSASSVTFTRKKGVAHYPLSATLRDADGTLVGGALVYLQTSANGTTKWKNSYALSTNGAGVVSKAFSSHKTGTLYYRWSAPASSGYNAALTSKQRVQVK